ncbi:MAG: MAPEG family protein [Gammaproteobacteria bacterium]|jgi:hypothetical protein|nr:MAPEG family protein [Gammaproteobacteria bacterium]MBT4493497.1 MAPEG family protein [Gammaproteobacteria bacterium]MBT7370124.1 MAPEG family protein [Gammaproteobacteria bacterium]
MPDFLSNSQILLPILVLVIWSLIMLLWTAATRLPTIAKLGLGPESGERTADLAALLPKEVQWKADNYNHLMEQPTIFYATAIVLAIAGLGEGLNLYMAWFYVGSRIVHSIVHVTVNFVPVRFTVFLLGTVSLLVMAVNGTLQIVG